MANQIDGGSPAGNPVGGIDQEQKVLAEREGKPGRNDRRDEELENERLEPGLHTGGEGASGADPAKPNGDGNSNT